MKWIALFCGLRRILDAHRKEGPNYWQLRIQLAFVALQQFFRLRELSALLAQSSAEVLHPGIRSLAVLQAIEKLGPKHSAPCLHSCRSATCRRLHVKPDNSGRSVRNAAKPQIYGVL